jgi:hypothetical protein
MASRWRHRVFRIKYTIAIKSEVFWLILLFKFLLKVVLRCFGYLFFNIWKGTLGCRFNILDLRPSKLFAFNIHISLCVWVMWHFLRAEILILYQDLSWLTAKVIDIICLLHKSLLIIKWIRGILAPRANAWALALLPIFRGSLWIFLFDWFLLLNLVSLGEINGDRPTRYATLIYHFTILLFPYIFGLS